MRRYEYGIEVNDDHTPKKVSGREKRVSKSEKCLSDCARVGGPWREAGTDATPEQVTVLNHIEKTLKCYIVESAEVGWFMLGLIRRLTHRLKGVWLKLAL